MRIYIDTCTFPASPALYADAEKTKPLPRILPAVELQRGGFEVAFIGLNQPQDIATVALAASVEGTQTQVVAELGKETDDGEAWRFDFALNSESLVAEVANRGSARLRVGVIVEDDTERREWQFTTAVYPTASSGETDVEAVESAKDWAELAEQSAKDAQEAQAKVSADAQAAQESKQTAMQAANAAIEAADNAEVAERNAADSKSAAEKAKTDAESAKAAAEKAASDAQATLANVYTKPEIDGVATGAEVTLKMNEIHAMLKDYEEVTGEKLPFDFWEAVMAEFQRWQMNPNEVKEWVTTSATESTNPYFSEPPTKPVVDFSVTKAAGVLNGDPSFSIDTDEIIFVSHATNIESILSKNRVGINHVIAPNAKYCYSAFRSAGTAKALINIFYFPKLEVGYALFANCRSDFCVITPSASDLQNAFNSTLMSPENISKTLDSLPIWADGKRHIVSFAYSPGSKKLTQDSPSVAAAVAKGWTVEL